MSENAKSEDNLMLFSGYSPSVIKKLDFNSPEETSEDNDDISDLREKYKEILSKNEVAIAEAREKCKETICNRENEIRKKGEQEKKKRIISEKEKNHLKENISFLKNDIESIKNAFNTGYNEFKEMFQAKRNIGIETARKLQKIKYDAECELKELKKSLDIIEKENAKPRIVCKLSNFLSEWFLSNSDLIQKF